MAAREDLEGRWRDRLVEEPRLTGMVTGAQAQREPFHRWIKYRQGFSPALVRMFLRENAGRGGWERGAILDPFAGAGTAVVECARCSVRAVGVEALASLVFLTAAKWSRKCPPPRAVDAFTEWRQIADRLTTPIHRAALMLAVARQHTSAGHVNRGALPLPRLLADCMAMIRDDLVQPLTTAGLLLHGDARRMDMVADESIGGIITSPPYLSRYDYRETVNPVEQVHRHWYGPPATNPAQVQASPGTTGSRNSLQEAHAAVNEVCSALTRSGHEAQARTVQNYWMDMRTVLQECRRVLARGAPFWLVMGGARLKNVYVPADLIIAETAEMGGFHVDAVKVARDLIPGRRRFGRIGSVSPRESLLVIHKP